MQTSRILLRHPSFFGRAFQTVLKESSRTHVQSRMIFCEKQYLLKERIHQFSTNIVRQRSNRRWCSSTTPKSKTTPPSVPEQTAPTQEKLSIFKRFKKTYKEHGKILVCVHVATSIVWYGSFYLTLSSGFDLVGYLGAIDMTEKVIKPLSYIGITVSPERIDKIMNILKSSGNFAGAYLLYKIATPARYTVTLGGTNIVIRYFRHSGKMPKIKEGEKIRDLYKDSKVVLREKRKAFRTRRRLSASRFTSQRKLFSKDVKRRLFKMSEFLKARGKPRRKVKNSA